MNWISDIISYSMQQVEINHLVDFPLILHKRTNLVYMKRELDSDILRYADLLFQHNFSGINCVIAQPALVSVVNDELDKIGLHTVGKIKLREDIINLSQQFFQVTKAINLRLILKVVANDGCAKFHTDAYALRLLCTYAGRATEWIADEYVNRNKLITGTNEDIIKDFSKVQAMQPFEVAILKGETQQTGTKGIVHRSPAIQQLGEKRLLLRLDY
ncbi:MAG TPA: hypothetical protein DHV26_17970 [Cytophagales bacterium]|nr:hypothetical protein [Cytophagales bacterium]HRG08851.1 DUF1826 domain-containing protein [Cyclobacteriaceae bacterium]